MEVVLRLSRDCGEVAHRVWRGCLECVISLLQRV